MITDELFDLKDSIAERLFLFAEYPWEALSVLEEYIRRVGKGLGAPAYDEVKKGVWVARSAAVSETAELIAPLIIEEGAEVGNNSLVLCSIVGLPSSSCFVSGIVCSCFVTIGCGTSVAFLVL